VFVLVDDGGVEPEVDVSSGSGIRIFPLLDGFFVYWIGRGILFGDSNVFPLLVCPFDGMSRVLRLRSGAEQDPPLALAGEIYLHHRSPYRIVGSGEVGNGGEDGVGGGAGHCFGEVEPANQVKGSQRIIATVLNPQNKRASL